jgi:hypothetical protein
LGGYVGPRAYNLNWPAFCIADKMLLVIHLTISAVLAPITVLN